MNVLQKRVIKNTFVLFAGSISAQIIGFFTTVYIARKFGSNLFGTLSFVQAFVGYFGILTNFGIGTIAVKEVSRDKKLTQEYAGSLILINTIFSLLAFSLLFTITYFIHFDYFKKWLIILTGLSFFAGTINVSWVFNAHEKMEYSAILQTIGSILYLSGIYIVLSKLNSVLVIPIISFICYILVGIISIGLFIKFFGKLKLKFDFKYWQNLIISALPLGCSSIMVRIYYNLDTVMLSFMQNDTVVGWYNASYKIILMLISLAGFYFNAIFPILAKQYKTSLESFQSVLQKSARIMVILSLPLGIGGTILAGPIMNCIFGIEYSSGILAFQILLWAVCIIYISMVYGNTLIACDKQKELFKIVSCAAMTNLIANFLLIPKFSLYGAAIATVIAEGVAFFLSFRELSKIVRVPFIKYIPKPLCASLFMGIVLFFIKNWNVFLLIIIGFVIYFMILFLLKDIFIKNLFYRTESKNII